MSMPIIATNANAVSLQQALNDVIESVALEETALSHILNAEGEKIQRVVNDSTATFDQILQINASADAVINTVINLQTLLNSKLDTAINALP